MTDRQQTGGIKLPCWRKLVAAWSSGARSAVVAHVDGGSFRSPSPVASCKSATQSGRVMMAFWSKRTANKEKRMMFLARGLGAEVVSGLSRTNPSFSTDQKQYVLDQVLDEVCRTVRETAYVAAALPLQRAIHGASASTLTLGSRAARQQ
jgi:hypothetical protein